MTESFGEQQPIPESEDVAGKEIQPKEDIPNIDASEGMSVRKTTHRLEGKPASEIMEKLRQRILAEIPQNREGINTERVENFMQEKGHDITPYMIINQEHLPQFFAIARELFPDYEQDVEDTNGFYNAPLQLVVVIRQPEKEKNNSTVLTESVLVHEQAHATGGKTAVMKQDGLDGYIRLGTVNSAKNEGHFLEEGYVELLASEYRAQFLPEENKRSLCNKLDISPDEYNKTILGATTEENREVTIWVPTVILDENGDFSTPPAATPASALMLIAHKYPEFRGLLDESRKNPMGVRKLKQWFQQFGLDMWKTLQKSSYDREWFAWTQKILLQRIKTAASED